MVGRRTCKNLEHRPNHSNVAMARRLASMHVSERAFCPSLFDVHNVASRLYIIDGVGFYIRSVSSIRAFCMGEVPGRVVRYVFHQRSSPRVTDPGYEDPLFVLHRTNGEDEGIRAHEASRPPTTIPTYPSRSSAGPLLEFRLSFR